MEVHAHTHTPRKKWTHYLWEFLMLFLAVTLGFLVENQREHYIENKREKQYVQSFYDDLTAAFSFSMLILMANVLFIFLILFTSIKQLLITSGSAVRR